MAITAGDVRNGLTVEVEGGVYQVIEFQHVKPGKGAAFVRTKLKDVRNGGVVERTFRPTEKLEEARIDRSDMQYLYSDGDLYYFMDVTTYDALVECVKGGAKLVMTARTGSYVPELGTEEPYRLLTAFGIPAPKGEFCRKGEEVRATAAKESDLFPEGFSFPVETSDRQRAQLLDPAVQGEFWKYRWRFIPETDYFGYHPGVKAGGEVLASFSDGGDAVTRHRFGKGEVVVFWGVPDICGENMKGFMKRAARWAGVDNPLERRELRYCLEGRNAALGRHYLLAWQEKPGSYRVTAPNCPDGTFFMDDPISCERLGTVDGKELREKGVRVEWSAGRSPLRFLRLIPRRVLDARCDWAGKYP